MSRHIVDVTTAVLIVTSVACSRTDSPVAVKPRIADQSTAAYVLPPIAPGVHVGIANGLDGAVPLAINDFGEVVGYDDGSFFNDAFKWQGSRGLTLFTGSSAALAVNNRGQVVVINVGNGGQVGIWDWYGHLRPLRRLSDYTVNPADPPSCRGLGINDNGVVVGACTIDPTKTTLATVWTAFGTPDALFTGGAGTAIKGFASAVSNTGIVVGTDSARQSAFVFTGEGHVRYLSHTGGSTGVAVNDSGWVAGSADDSAAVWIHGDSLVKIPGLQPGYTAAAVGVSNSGEVIGNGTCQFIWTRAHGTQCLPGLEGPSVRESAEVFAINNHHQIVGTIVTSTSQLHTVIWTLPSN